MVSFLRLARSRVCAFCVFGTLCLASCGGSTTGTTATSNPPEIESALHYLKASNTGDGDLFGYRIAMSADGRTLAVGAHGESSGATRIDGDQRNNSAYLSGAVYVFVRSGNTWVQQAYVKASNAETEDLFGVSVALSGDGNTLAVGAVGEDSSTRSDPRSNTASLAGAAYVFTRQAGVWSQQVYLKASNAESSDYFGTSIALSDDGNKLAVGAPGESSNGVEANNDLPSAGAAYLFERNHAIWHQTAYVKAPVPGQGDQFGRSLSLSADGLTLAVGAQGESSDGDPTNDNILGSGAVYVFQHTGAGWGLDDFLKASNPGAFDEFGWALALSADGRTLAVGAHFEESGATRINGPLADQQDNTRPGSGAVYVFSRDGGAWRQQAYVKAGNTDINDEFGFSVALAADGNTLMVGAHHEDSKSRGLQGDQSDNTVTSAGAAYVFTRMGGTWTPRAYVKASNTGLSDEFGNAVALSGDARVFAVGASGEASKATGIDGNQTDDAAPQAGAVYVLSITTN